MNFEERVTPIAEEVISALLENEQFNSLVLNQETHSISKIENVLDDILSLYGISVSGGAERISFLLPLEGFVIKFDWDGTFSACQREYDNYEAAAFSGLSQYFAESFPLYKGGYWFLIQEFMPSVASESEEFFEFLGDDYYERDLYEMTDSEIYSAYTDEDEEGQHLIFEKIFEKINCGADSENFLEFLTLHSINDLHGKNFYVDFKKGVLKLIDYAGFIW